MSPRQPSGGFATRNSDPAIARAGSWIVAAVGGGALALSAVLPSLYPATNISLALLSPILVALAIHRFGLAEPGWKLFAVGKALVSLSLILGVATNPAGLSTPDPNVAEGLLVVGRGTELAALGWLLQPRWVLSLGALVDAVIVALACLVMVWVAALDALVDSGELTLLAAILIVGAVGGSIARVALVAAVLPSSSIRNPGLLFVVGALLAVLAGDVAFVVEMLHDLGNSGWAAIHDVGWPLGRLMWALAFLQPSIAELAHGSRPPVPYSSQVPWIGVGATAAVIPLILLLGEPPDLNDRMVVGGASVAAYALMLSRAVSTPRRLSRAILTRDALDNLVAREPPHRARTVTGSRHRQRSGIPPAWDQLREGRLVTQYQPIVNLSSGRTIAFEALARLDLDGAGRLPPSEFIPAAIAGGEIVSVGRNVLDQACQQIGAWRSSGVAPSDGMVFVNLHPDQLAYPDFVGETLDILERSRVPPSALVLEVTEEAIADPARVAGTLEALRARGVRFAIDDFGTGYSALSYLSIMPVDILKIDQSFVRGIHAARERLVVSHVVQLARDLHLGVVAEGIETTDQLASVRSLQCDLGQGYLLGPPVDPEVIQRA